jgi:hypothetical protein
MAMEAMVNMASNFMFMLFSIILKIICLIFDQIIFKADLRYTYYSSFGALTLVAYAWGAVQVGA